MRSASKKAEEMWKATLNPSLIFGGKKNFLKRKKKEITEKEFNINRLIPIQMTGSKADVVGNRKFKMDCEKWVFTVKLKEKLNLEVGNTSKRNIELLKKAFNLASEHIMPITYLLNKDYIFIIFDESYLRINNIFIKDRTMALDLNPNYIGFSIVNNNNIIFKEVIKIKIKNKKKKKFELSQVAKYLTNIAIHFKVEIVGIEKLEIKYKDYKKGKNFNRTINNDWLNNYFINVFIKNLNLNGIKHQFILSAYSSFLGCINNPNDVDSIAASLEINRRLQLFKKIYLDKIQDKQEIIFPRWDPSKLPTRWKEMVESDNGILSWKDLFYHCKNTKTSYRVLFDSYSKNRKVLRFKSPKSEIVKIKDEVYLN